MIVTITAEAIGDIEGIGDYIARDNPERAISYIGELREKCLTLADYPERFPLVARYESQGIRRRVHGNYLIFYRIEAEQVVVLHVLHGAQEYAAILFPS
jgi:plasmid stabilization system protein ParE